MEIFYSNSIIGEICTLPQEESQHCVKVLRHKSGDRICVIDGEGTFYDCTLLDTTGKEATAHIDSIQECWGAHDYKLTMAVCPTKNIDRYEWFAEKATEFGIDRICPVIGEHSERKIIKTERLNKILLSATKQSLKGAIPAIDEACSVLEFIKSVKTSKAVKMIAYCFEEEQKRTGITEVLTASNSKEYIILIGPEGDFSHTEVTAAIEAGFIPVHLGESRLRTETAAVAAVSAVYFHQL